MKPGICSFASTRNAVQIKGVLMAETLVKPAAKRSPS